MYAVSSSSGLLRIELGGRFAAHGPLGPRGSRCVRRLPELAAETQLRGLHQPH